jgi:DUF2934 family protein
MKGQTQSANTQPTNSEPTHDQIAQRAYEIFLAHGATDGQDVEDWLCAEGELRTA